MRSIAVYSLKGGVGKTTLAVNLAWAAATRSARKTLLWDLDAQSAASYLLGADGDGPSEAQGVFAKEVNPTKLVQTTNTPRLDLLAADASLRGLDHFLHDLDKKKRLLKLIERLGQDYDRIILDAPPGLTDTSEQVLRAADLILVPLIPSPLSQRAFDEVLAFLDRQPDPARTGPAGLQHGRPPPLAPPRRARGACRLAGRTDGERVRDDERHSGRRRPAARRLPGRDGGEGRCGTRSRSGWPAPADEESRPGPAAARLCDRRVPDVRQPRRPRRLLGRAAAAGDHPAGPASISRGRSARRCGRAGSRSPATTPSREVVRRCAEREDTWINDEIEHSYICCTGSGHAHSVEVWQDGELAGGLYGVRLGAAFFGESMFSLANATPRRWRLAWLVARLIVGGFRLLDCQFMTEHLRRLGAIEIDQKAYLALLASALGGGSAGAAAGGAAPARRREPAPAPVPARSSSTRSTGCSPAGPHRLAAAGMGHRAALGPDVVDRVLDDVEATAFPCRASPRRPAGTGPADCARRAGRRRRSAAAPPRARSSRRRAAGRSTSPTRTAWPGLQREFARDAVALVEQADHRDALAPSASCPAPCASRSAECRPSRSSHCSACGIAARGAPVGSQAASASRAAIRQGLARAAIAQSGVQA